MNRDGSQADQSARESADCASTSKLTEMTTASRRESGPGEGDQSIQDSTAAAAAQAESFRMRLAIARRRWEIALSIALHGHVIVSVALAILVALGVVDGLRALVQMIMVTMLIIKFSDIVTLYETSDQCIESSLRQHEAAQ